MAGRLAYACRCSSSRCFASRLYMCLLLKDAAPYVTGTFPFHGDFMDENIIKWAENHTVYLKYPHFDFTVGLKDVITKVADPKYIKSHAFVPFIYEPRTYKKYSKEKGRYIKERKIYVSGHFDRCVYQYYSHLLNEKYNRQIRNEHIQDVTLAYRSDLHKSNIHFAKEVFDFIRNNPGCSVMIGDFKDFFDNIDHDYLKKQLCKLLNVDRLPEDYYKVFKSITRFSYVAKSDIDILKKEEKLKVPKSLELSMSTLRMHNEIIHCNKKSYGIPQGSAISAVLSNIYMMEFDNTSKRFANKYKGLYKRYCDDFVFVLPNTDEHDIKNIFTSVLSIVGYTPRLILSAEKTKIYLYDGKKVYNKGKIIKSGDSEKCEIDYLGFTFNGEYIRIRDKTISKYYYRAYGRADVIRKNNESPNKQRTYGCEKLYKAYSAKGDTDENLNFISYVRRCKNVFGESKGITKILHTHYGKLKKRLGKRGDK